MTIKKIDQDKSTAHKWSFEEKHGEASTDSGAVIRIVMVIIFLLTSNSCLWEDEPLPKPDPKPVIKEFTGKLKIDVDDPTKFSDLEIVSSQEIRNIESDGTFTINSTENDKYQLFFISSKGTDETLFFGINEPNSSEILANDSSTAIGLLLINPSLLGIPQNYREDYVQAVVRHEDFSNLTEEIRKARKEKKTVSADLSTNPIISQYIIRIMEESMQSLNSSSRVAETEYYAASVEVFDHTGNTIGFQNWRHVFYSAEIDNRTTGKKSDVLLNRIEKAVTWKWWLPGPVITKGVKTFQYESDGNLVINFYKWNWQSFGEDNAQGRASMYNTLLATFYLVDMVMGGTDFKNKDKFDNLIADIAWSDAKILFAEQHGSDAFSEWFKACTEFLMANAKPLIKEFTGGNEAKIAKLSGKAWNNIFKAVTIAGWANEHIPFYIDLMRGPDEILGWRYSHNKGVLTRITENITPYAELEFSPSIGYGNTPFTFQATAAEDDFTPEDHLEFRWKINDGAWSDYSNERTLEITLANANPTTINLEVMDEDGASVIVTRQIPFYESIKRNRIIVMTWCGAQESDWSEYLKTLGFTAEGELKQLITAPANVTDTGNPIFQLSILNPVTDLLIINPCSVCPEWLDIMEENRLGILHFVQQGGGLLMILDHYSVGEIERSNKILPFKIQFNDKAKIHIQQPWSSTGDNYDFLGEAGYYIPGSGLSKTTDINHFVAYLFNEKEGVIHLINEVNEPVLVEKKLGSGIMMGAITAPAFSFNIDEHTKNRTILCTNTINYLVEE